MVLPFTHGGSAAGSDQLSAIGYQLQSPAE
jgi:hypothetical protein